MFSYRERILKGHFQSFVIHVIPSTFMKALFDFIWKSQSQKRKPERCSDTRRLIINQFWLKLPSSSYGSYFTLLVWCWILVSNISHFQFSVKEIWFSYKVLFYLLPAINNRFILLTPRLSSFRRVSIYLTFFHSFLTSSFNPLLTLNNYYV